MTSTLKVSARLKHAVQENHCFCSSFGDMLEDAVVVKQSVNCVTKIQRSKAIERNFKKRTRLKKETSFFVLQPTELFFGILELNGLGKGQLFKGGFSRYI